MTEQGESKQMNWFTKGEQMNWFTITQKYTPEKNGKKISHADCTYYIKKQRLWYQQRTSNKVHIHCKVNHLKINPSTGILVQL